ILQDELGLSVSDASWSYDLPMPEGKKRTLSLDGRIPLDKLTDAANRRISAWIASSAKSLDVADRISASLTGAVFEVRQGYKSKDAKRQNADIANSTTAYTKSYLPAAVILSSQSNGDILLRYRAEK